jgi:FkbM family methyltransferase
MYFGARRLDRYLRKDGINKAQIKIFKKYVLNEWVVKEDWIVVETGANVGEFTIALAEKKAFVYAFEPDPNVYKCLVHNMRNHGEPRVKLLPIAASDEVGDLDFFIASDSADSSIIEPDIYSEKIRVKAVRLDKWIDEENLQRIDLLKVEAEGYEPEVLKGLGDKLSIVKRVSVDASPERRGCSTDRDVIMLLKAAGFTVTLDGYMVYGSKA